MAAPLQDDYPTFPVYKAFASEDAVTALGLSEERAAEVRARWGPNKLPERVRPWHELLLKQFKGPMPGMIIVAIVLTIATESWADMSVCSFMLLLNAFLGFNEERHAQAAAMSLKEQAKAEVTVFRRREGDPHPTGVVVPTEDLVPGDVVYLKHGQKVPADCQWLHGAAALCCEAALTGESVEVPKGGADSIVVLKVEKQRTLEQTLGVNLDGLRAVLVHDSGPAAAADLREGDGRVVVRVNGVEVASRQEAESAFRGAPAHFSVALMSRDLLGGATIKKCTKCYALVEKTAERSMLGEAARNAAQGPSKGEFQLAIEFMVKCVIGSTLCIVVLCFVWQVFVQQVALRLAALSAIALCIGSVPVALPVVLTVTQALGASLMAKDKAIVTNLRAMQEIAVMQILCSDKTGTLTTAEMEVYEDKIVTVDPDTRQTDVMVYAVLASDKNNLDDPIDRAVLKKFRTCMPEPQGAPEPDQIMQKAVVRDWEVRQFVGFSSETKRVCAFCENRKTGQKLLIGKGILSKVVDTRYVGNELGDPDDGVQWRCDNVDLATVEPHDTDLSRHGFKTISVCVQELSEFPDFQQSENKWQLKGGPMRFVGILPMQDPPRHDSREVIQAIRELGVQVKMITGDHTNIAIETARQISLGDRILDRKQLLVPGTKELDLGALERADGFAQVLPLDKSRIVRALQDEGSTVGMTGDGANDAAALGAANVGIAVKGAVDSARAASDILLTQGGLYPIKTAIIESRKIFQRLRAYVIYRVGHTIHVVLTLTHLILHHNVTLHPMYVIVMALFNDLAITMIGYDNARPTKNPSVPKIFNMLFLAFVMGLVQSAASTLLYELLLPATAGAQQAPENALQEQGNEYAQTIMYVQMAVTAGGLIFQARTPRFVCSGNPPGRALVLAVAVPCMLATVMAGTGTFVHTPILWMDILYIWLYNIAVFFAIEACKVTITTAFPEELPEIKELGRGGRGWGYASMDRAQHSGLLAHQDSLRGELSRRQSGYGTMQGPRHISPRLPASLPSQSPSR
eukprot:TRINITY_DN18202_c0_g1_i1.p1 TRINITY_DN18202_c0_g1~~TRINITY_DN18202_c0_g1_i1.p1  ORF type:complete len:1028 (+),score=412.69 TRINITY_DN18202_c0_g1_i1:116-3199(+)